MTHYLLIAETDAFGSMLRVTASPSPTGWTITTEFGEEVTSRYTIAATGALEAAEVLILAFTDAQMRRSIRMDKEGADPPGPHHRGPF